MATKKKPGQHLDNLDDTQDESQASEDECLQHLEIPSDDDLVTPTEDQPEEPPLKLSLNEVALEVRSGKWGSGQDRRLRLAQAGYDHRAVQQEIVRQANNRANL